MVRKEGKKEGEATRNCVGGDGEEKWKPDSGIKRLKGRNGERERERDSTHSEQAAGKSKSLERKPFYSGNRDHGVVRGVHVHTEGVRGAE